VGTYRGTVTRLVLVNGVPASGKSTLAHRYADEDPLTLVLDIDLVRRMLGGWKDSLNEAGLLARRIAVEMARTHLRAGRDVVVPQFLGRVGFVQTLAELCEDVGADFVEVVLLSSPDEAVSRFVRRSVTSTEPGDRDAAAQVERDGGADAQLRAMYHQLLEVVAARPASWILTTIEGDIDATYAALREHVLPPAR
jgi:predicted kinase